eukprot:Colp12_sorted_trinity150504_noHs@17687
MALSASEASYIINGIEQDIREDGRRRKDYRHFTIETGVVSNTNGSARLRLGSTDILVGVKAEIGEPTIESPHNGRVVVSVDCSATSSPSFEGRGGELLSLELSQALE